MKTAYQKFVRMLGVITGCLALMVVLNSCSKDQEQVSPNLKAESAASAKVGTLSEPPGGCPTGTWWDPIARACVPYEVADPCEGVSAAKIDASQRAKAVARYGQNGGKDYDTAKREVAAMPSLTYIANYSSRVLDYTRQIEAAVMNGSKAYMASASSTTAYNASTYLSYLNSYLNPLKNKITNDLNLTSPQRTALLQAFTAIPDNFTQASNLATNNLNCFPDPANLNTAGTPGAISTNGLDTGVSVNGWFGSKFKKIVNIVATILKPVIENSIRFGASLTFFTFGTLPGAPVIGGFIGALVGLVQGVYNVKNGKYECVFSCI